VRFVIIGGGPAGNTAATVAASIGAEVTLIERDVVGGAAHLWDCIPSKAMVATQRLTGSAARWDSARTACSMSPAAGTHRPDRRRLRRHGEPARSQGVRLILAPAGSRTKAVVAVTDAGEEESPPARSCCPPVPSRACPVGGARR
jgi:pyruvate/2-oxoglutarate dehydrogenase complex dihydrolipoamide dehydrogenase (E3) component